MRRSVIDRAARRRGLTLRRPFTLRSGNPVERTADDNTDRVGEDRIPRTIMEAEKALCRGKMLLHAGRKDLEGVQDPPKDGAFHFQGPD